MLFLVEQEGKRKAYIDVVRAGGGTVLEDWDLDQLIKYKPGKGRGRKGNPRTQSFRPANNFTKWICGRALAAHPTLNLF